MSNNLYKDRIDKDISIRSYYGKFIFNSHFLVFLAIAGGFFLYSLLGFVENANYNAWMDIIPSILLGLAIMTKYRSLLKQADQVFLPPYENHMSAYFRKMSTYSMMIGAPKVFISLIIALILYSVGNGAGALSVISIYTVFSYVMTFRLRRAALNSKINDGMFSIFLVIINTAMFMLMTVSPYSLIAGVVILYAVKLYINKNSYKIYDWPTFIQFEERQLSKYYRNVSMFTNVKHIDKQFKRRAYLDKLLWQPKKDKYDKEHMYEFLFYRSFLRDHDLPMIILRLLIILGVIMIWMNQLVLSIVIVLFGIYLIVLQMSQIYTAQAYLLWPKVWPVRRDFIQKSYVKYSHKVVFIITLLFGVLFVCTHPAYFYISIIFPVWGYLINQVFSKSVYKKERLLSD
jgi:ABC-2 type transport system permease protein